MSADQSDIDDLEHRKVLWAALEVDPDGYESNRDFGLYCASRRKYHHLAEPHLLKAIAFNNGKDDFLQMLFSLSFLCHLKGDFVNAKDQLQTVLTLKPNDPFFMFYLGDVEFELGNFAESSKLYNQANAELERDANIIAERTDEPVTRILASDSLVHRYIGETVCMLELFVKARKLGLLPDFRALLLAPEDEIANPCMLDFWRDYVDIITDRDEIKHCQEKYGGGEFRMDYIAFPDHIIAGGPTFGKDISQTIAFRLWEEQNSEPLLKLTPDHAERGRKQLAEMGVPADAWFVCVHVREEGYYGDQSPFSPNKYRNADIDTYIPAIDTITRRGGWVVRLGDKSTKPLPKMERVIDYAQGDDISDWMDIFLFASCRFCLGTASGPVSVSNTFSIPVVGTNWYSLGNWPNSRNDIFIHKLLKEKDTGRILGLAEALTPPLYNALSPGLLKDRGLEVVPNTPEEIQEATEEMLDRLDGTLRYSDEDERRREQFRRIADPHKTKVSSRVARRFLERHPELIED